MGAKKKPATKKPKAEKGVIDIELTPEQQELIQRQSNGALNLTTLRLRPDLNLRLQELTTVLGASSITKQSVANGSDGTWWA
ncbi:MAG TPA: hypothetical protein VEO54_24330 [Thermoanaerobaculia bacterium]|nr:hypothetical protein [Thermoanaerobaculia bacterium]